MPRLKEAARESDGEEAEKDDVESSEQSGTGVESDDDEGASEVDEFSENLSEAEISEGEIQASDDDSDIQNEAERASDGFNFPDGVCVDPEGKNIYVCDGGNHRIVQLVGDDVEILTFAGEGAWRGTRMAELTHASSTPRRVLPWPRMATS